MRGVIGGRWPVAGLAAAACLAAAGAVAQTRVIDDFASVPTWKAAPSDGVSLAVAADTGESGGAMRLDFDFHGHGGWAAVRRPVDFELPENYELTFRMKADAPSENLELKLVDASGDNVWWAPRRDFSFPREWTTLHVRKRQVSFAWGPAGGGEIRRPAFLEIAISAGSGGKGTVWISGLALTALPPEHPYAGTPVASASSSLPGHGPGQAISGESGGWRSDPAAPGDAWVQLDFGERREIGGLAIEWNRSAPASEVLTSDDGAVWVTAWPRREIHGSRSFVPLPEAACRYVRVVGSGAAPDGVAVSKLTVEPPEFAAVPNAFIASIARVSRRGLYPRAFLGEMTAWTLVGDPAPIRPSALLSADGAFEPAPRTFTVEPFVWLDGKLVTWTDVASGQTLAGGDLPVPSVTWHHPSFDLEIAASRDPAGTDATLLRYRFTETAERRAGARLFVAVRPLQVNPPAQFLNIAGGANRLARIVAAGRTVTAAGFTVEALTPAASAGAAAFGDGDVVSWLAHGDVPDHGDVSDPSGWASGVVTIDLSPTSPEEVWVRVAPEGAASPATPSVEQRRAAMETAWADTVRRVTISGGPEVEAFAAAVRSNLAFILASRDHAALQPGTRNYARSWIRDGAMMAAALLRLGRAEEVRDYLRWYAPFQFADGRVPCVVDSRGSDPVPENDSHGELLFLAAEYLRYTGDEATVREVWPHLAAAAGYIDELRHTRRTEAYRAPDRLAFFGLLPESISHEGYSAKPMHSYWDDFWALKGLADAAWMAERSGRPADAARWVRVHDEFERDVLASIERVRAEKGLAWLPGCAEMGDFDATSSTVALWPTGVDAELPHAAVEATWERYWREVEARFNGRAAWEGYTPYEWRSVSSFVRFGWRDRAVQLARWLMADRMPVAWNQWPEVVHENPTRAAYLGDLPHAWVGSDYIRSFLDMLAYERPADRALVLGAGVPVEWLAGEGIAVHGLGTQYGTLSFTMRAEADGVRIRIESGVRVPPGGVVLRPPLGAGPYRATLDGASVAAAPSGEVVVRSLPATVTMAPLSAPAPPRDRAVSAPPAREEGAGGGSMPTGFLFRSLTLDGRVLKAAVYVPRGYDPARTWPLILFLHGSGESGTDGSRELAQGLPRELVWNPDAWPFIVVMPQKPSQDLEWEQLETEVMTLLAQVRREYSVDPTRLVLTGLSQGGHGAWVLAARHPGMWAAVVPVCGYGPARRPGSGDLTGTPGELAARIGSVPVWAFHGEADDVVPVGETRAVVDALKAAGSPPRVTIYPGVGHGCWERAYGEPELPRWLLAQRRPGPGP
ncbi:MAG TPA: dienelactone hydrolase family protein [Thermoanaerobaculaceae bacterium]|nr:dienelactone hydrolase family protein [Thermoanaerobaculaceae bacterium]